MNKKIIASIVLITPFCLTACGPEQPVLTQTVFSQAAQKCGLDKPLFTKSFIKDALPIVSYTDHDLATTPPGQATKSSECLAKEIKGYRLKSMNISHQPLPPIKASK